MLRECFVEPTFVFWAADHTLTSDCDEDAEAVRHRLEEFLAESPGWEYES
jgi:hypothetical protein